MPVLWEKHAALQRQQIGRGGPGDEDDDLQLDEPRAGALGGQAEREAVHLRQLAAADQVSSMPLRVAGESFERGRDRCPDRRRSCSGFRTELPSNCQEVPTSDWHAHCEGDPHGGPGLTRGKANPNRCSAATGGARTVEAGD